MAAHGAVQVATEQHGARFVHAHIFSTGGFAIELSSKPQLEAGAVGGHLERSRPGGRAAHMVVPGVAVDEAHGGAGGHHTHGGHEAHLLLLHRRVGWQQAGVACRGRVQHHDGVGHGFAVLVEHLDLNVSGCSARPHFGYSY